MKKYSFVLVLAVVLTSVSKTGAQSPSPKGSDPCADEPSLGRPVLKRRQTYPDDQSNQEQAQAGRSESQPCDTSSLVTKTTPQQNSVTIEFEGLSAASESDLRKYLREQRINRLLDTSTDSSSIAQAEATIKEFLSDRGYRSADVSSRFELKETRSKVLTFLISEGSRFTISEIKFQGVRVFPGQLLAARMKECIARDAEYHANTFRSDMFEYCLHTLANFERSQGYLQARFGEPKIQEVGESLVITLQSDEGILYRVGNVEIEGADHVSEAEIREMLGMRRGDIASGEKIARTMYEDLKAVYGDKGFIQYTAEVEPTFHSEPGASEGVVDLKITIDEGGRFRIRKISFKGENLPESDLRQLLLLRDGDVYTQKLFEESVKRINDTGWFIPLDKDKDVDFRTNEEEKLVDVVIKLTRRNEID